LAADAKPLRTAVDVSATMSRRRGPSMPSVSTVSGVQPSAAAAPRTAI
jgi:hypothetical protein